MKQQHLHYVTQLVLLIQCVTTEPSDE